MFKKNDKVYRIAHIAVYILLAIEVLASFIVPISTAVVYKNAVLILYVFPALIGCGIELLFIELIFSFLCDVKFIRNKLYGEDNSDLLNFGSSQNNIDTKNKDEKIIIETKEDGHSEDSNRIKYAIKDGVGIVAIQSKFISGALKISSQIRTNDDTNNVATIGKYAFSRCKNLTSIEIPSSVTSIGIDAFANCNGLTIYCEAESKQVDGVLIGILAIVPSYGAIRLSNK